MKIYSEKNFIKVFIIISILELLLFMVIGVFLGFISSKNILISLFFGVLCGIVALLLLIPQIIIWFIIYFFRIKGSVLEINKEGIKIGRRYLGPIKSINEFNLWHSRTYFHHEDMFIPWQEIEKIEFYTESWKNKKDLIIVMFLSPRDYFVIKSGGEYYAKIISGLRWDIKKKIKDAIEQEQKNFLVSEKEYSMTSGFK